MKERNKEKEGKSRKSRREKQAAQASLYGQRFPMPHIYLILMWWANGTAALKGPMTYDSTQDNFVGGFKCHIRAFEYDKGSEIHNFGIEIWDVYSRVREAWFEVWETWCRVWEAWFRVWPSERPDLSSERPDLGSKNLRSERPYWGGRCPKRTERKKKIK